MNDVQVEKENIISDNSTDYNEIHGPFCDHFLTILLIQEARLGNI